MGPLPVFNLVCLFVSRTSKTFKQIKKKCNGKLGLGQWSNFDADMDQYAIPGISVD